MAHHAERLSERPCGEGVGGKALVIKRDCDLIIRIVEVMIERTEGGGHGERLVGNQAAGEGWHVEAVDFLGAVLDFPAAKVKLALVVVGIPAGGFYKEQVLDVGAGGECDFSEGGGINGNLAPTNGGNATFANDLGGNGFDG